MSSKRCLAITAALTFVGLLSGYQSAASQPPTVSITRESCRSCVVRMVVERTVQPVAGEIEFMPVTHLALQSNGSVIAGPLVEKGRFAVFPRSGPPRVVGKTGKGPGELDEVARFNVGPGDSLFVFQRNSPSVSVFGPGLEFARRFATPGTAIEIDFGGSAFAINSNAMSGTGFGPVQLYEGSRRVELLSPPTHNTPYLPNVRATFHDGSWIAVHRGEYVIDVFDSAGQLTRRMRRRLDWFPAAGEKTPSYVQVTDVMSHQGVLWVLIARTLPRKPNVASPGSDHVGPKMLAFDEIQENTEYYIDVIDPSAARSVTGPRRVRAHLSGFAGAGKAFGLVETSGELAGRIYRFELVR